MDGIVVRQLLASHRLGLPAAGGHVRNGQTLVAHIEAPESRVPFTLDRTKDCFNVKAVLDRTEVFTMVFFGEVILTLI